MRIPQDPQGTPGGGAACPPTIDLSGPDPSLVHNITFPSVRDQPYVREIETQLVVGKLLQATENFNYSADPSSCSGGQVVEMFPGLDLPMLSVNKGDLIKFVNMTNTENIAYGELQCEGDAL